MNSMHYSPSIPIFFTLIILLFCYLLKYSDARDSIIAGNRLNGFGDTLISSGNIFELGFFTTQSNQKSNTYLGIWYYDLVPKTVVWVANRDTPLSDSCNVFGVSLDGNLNVWCTNRTLVSIASVHNSGTFNTTLQLSNSGNLKLFGGQNGNILWQSFDYPTDTFLPGMKMDDNMVLTSWIDQNDPGTGDYTFKRDQGVYSVNKRSSVYWKSGDTGILASIFNEVPNFVGQILSEFDRNDQANYQSLGRRPNNYIPYPNDTRVSRYNNTRILMNSSGEIQYYFLGHIRSWSLLWSEPAPDSCSLYDACGKFAFCHINNNEPMCRCLPGFKSASSLEEWRVGEYSNGCDRSSTLCPNNATYEMHDDKFEEISLMKVGGQVQKFDRAQEDKACKEECLSNCKCEAYSFRAANLTTKRQTGNTAAKCWIWISELVNLQQGDSFRLVLRVPFSPAAPAPTNLIENSKGSNNNIERNPVLLAVLVAGAVILVFGSSYILYRRSRRGNGTRNHEDNPVFVSYESERQVNDFMDDNDKKGIDVPFYNLDTILSATDNFSNVNKLGQGGFGPVYKGKFPGGREIAVKRLSSCSVQGIEEFHNEVILIAKLQHRNLVRLLGYCVKENEKILLYEYMPNRSLDAFIFDRHNCLLLDWNKRFEIILGIARGLMYLHEDSRLRIIHRDLKTSNILLDEEMNPKISDFGLARILEGKGTEASTTKVVGTYGYMSPEYALDGKFSTKSDVFSFGIVMLEIISGKRNTGFYQHEQVLNLLGYAWRFWSENNATDLVDPTLVESCEKSQVLKCINVGLLCVQEEPDDRPSMSTVVVMLGSESTLPNPTRPAFVVRKRLSSTSSSTSTKPEMFSNNEVTMSIAEGR